MLGKRLNLRVLVEPVDVVCSVGDYATVSAVVRSPNPGFQWFDEHRKPIPTQTNRNLMLYPVKQEDFGNFILQIFDLETFETAYTRWVGLINKDAIGTETKHILLNSSPGGYYRIGSTFTLTADFRNATAYQWYKDGYILEGYTSLA